MWHVQELDSAKKEKEGFHNVNAFLVGLWEKTRGFLWYRFYSDKSGGRKNKRSVIVLLFASPYIRF